jgi:transcriptional regulator with XRE-family HTH domain
VGTAGIGDALRQARAAQGKDLAELAELTRIRPRVLAALERGDLDELGSAFYARAFLRTYAGALDLDPAPLLEALPEGEPEEERAALRRVPGTPEALGALGDPHPVVRRLASVALLLVLGAVLVAVDGWRPGGSQPSVIVPVMTEPQPVPVAAPQPLVLPPAPPAEPEAADPQPVQGVRVAVRGAESWVRITVDGVVEVEGVQPPGTVHVLEGEEVLVRAGNAGAVFAEVGDSGAVALGGGGEVVERRFSPESRS